jgi:hypothetical protein
MRAMKSIIATITTGMLLTMIAKADENSSMYKGEPVNILALMRVEDAMFHVYEPPYVAKAKYSSMDEAKCLTPESLMESIKSAVTQEWIEYNVKGRTRSVTQEQLEYRKSRNIEDNYFKLIHKLSFSYNGTPTAIIKYRFVDDGEDGVIAALITQKIDGRWYRTSILGLDRLEGAIRMYDSNILAVLFGMKTPEEERIVVELKQNSMTHAGVNTESLIEYFMKLHAERNMEALSILTGRDVSGK